jgi:hypothetical protein
MAYQGYRKNSPMALKQFISEFGANFTEYMKDKLMELESRSFLTRKDVRSRFDLKHVEHIQYECDCDSQDYSQMPKKEYSYGQFEVIDDILYFSEICLESNQVQQSQMVSTIYNSLNGEGTIFNDGRNLKKVDDKNIDFVVDSILLNCPQVSQSYLDIINGMVSRSDDKRTMRPVKVYTWGS